MKQSRQTGKTPAGHSMAAGVPALEPEAFAEAVQPFVEIGMKAQSEFLKLYGRRARAWFDWPGKFCACKTMQDLTAAQGGYLTTMQHDYAVYIDGVLRDAMLEQDELDEEDEDGSPERETETLHREAA